jgi:hypothetical protein
LGINSDVLEQIQKGKHFFCLFLKKNTINFIESSFQPISFFSLSEYINSVEIYTPKNGILPSYIAMNSTEINILEAGISSFFKIMDPIEKRISFFHLLGNTLNFEIVLPLISKFNIFSSHHVLNKKQMKRFDLFLPVVTFYEVSTKESFYIWLNNQLTGTFLFDFNISNSGDSQNNEYYLKMFSYILEKKLSLSFSLNKFVEKLFIHLGTRSKYTNNIFFSFHNITNIYYCSHNQSKFIGLDSSYNSVLNNIYAKNSETTFSVYKNIILQRSKKTFFPI